jgi:PPOX class probable FMN-dependent enzyme
MDPFATALSSTEQLAELYEASTPGAWAKDIGVIDDMARRLIALSPLVIVASQDAEGRADATPRGGPPGFVTVFDERHVVIPDATGNRRLDTLTNIVATGHAGLLFLIPGRDQTLRINGRACVSTEPEVLEAAGAVGKPPRTAIVVRTDELYAHCPKAFIRSKLWDPSSWPEPETVPSTAEVMLAHARNPDITIGQMQDYVDESLRTRLA